MTIKIILLKDVPKLGSKFEIKNVNSGYARNLLFPRHLALPATENSLKKLDGLKRKEKQNDTILNRQFDELNQETLRTILKFEEKASKEGKLFGSVDEEKIRKALSKKSAALNPEVKIELPKPLKRIGDYEINLVFHNKKIPLKLSILALKEGKNR